ncbi:hypothetical protein [Pleionea sp. CnH1-48]|uniref:hypothetical protein n=1 Tax=Pleionea sp. CnH1-48 TaxID=2954494 RepID=UPI00209800EF|nr:hypothetical protein [Pleionea sp. CnH1-48]MCO7225758.1 hypothetical protein [Pleionea sp. CnH1-48]
MILYSTANLKGQLKIVGEALLTHGYIDKEYALQVKGVRNLHDVVMRLRSLGWNIKTNRDKTTRLYTLVRNVSQESEFLMLAINNSLHRADFKLAQKQSEKLNKLLKSQLH